MALAPVAPPILGAVARTAIVRIRDKGGAESAEDRVAVEEPLEIRVGGKAATVIMRTPGFDEELARGFLYTEGLIRRLEDLGGIARPEKLGDEERGNVLDVTLAPALVTLRKGEPAFARNFYASSSCGVCGKSSLAAIAVKSKPVESQLVIDHRLVAALPERLRAAQAVFDVTGGLHAAALFDGSGALKVLREDVGRHNAVDKVIGWALGEKLVPASSCVLLVSGRTSFEIVQKTIAAGIPILCAVSAPSSLAVSLAERFGLTLVGFLRAGGMNVYAHPERITV